jgi:hypothetical protein
MAQTGFLQALADADLEALTAALARGYRSGSAERLARRDPAWWEAVEGAEREVGALYGALREADGTLLRWRQAVAELYRLWARVREESQAGDALEVESPRALEEVA